MNHIRIYILEDEVITQELLKQNIEELGFIVCGMAQNAEQALEDILQLKPDIALLDIKVEGSQSGIWLGNQLDIPFIYLTAYNDPNTIKNAIITKPVSYLVKPFNSNNLFIALELAVIQVKDNVQILVKGRDTNEFIAVNDILCAKKDDQYLIIYLKNSEKLIRSSIGDFIKLVDSSSFIQVHRSYIINKDHISSFNTKEIMIKNHIIPISKGFAKEVLELIY